MSRDCVSSSYSANRRTAALWLLAVGFTLVGLNHLAGEAKPQLGAVHRRAKHVPPPAADDGGGQRFRIRALEMPQPDGGLHVGRNGRRLRVGFEHRQRRAGRWIDGTLQACQTLIQAGGGGWPRKSEF